MPKIKLELKNKIRLYLSCVYISADFNMRLQVFIPKKNWEQ